ncbi:ricin-type beta-trefoil lectin domain protein [Actinoplanes regularis]|uniref:Glucosylceramidase n=1 Tax=Actinoplanes regularis TaxID=52697 RepID=A0A238YNV6_9ACTN|nr:ricin-type beta-trefoil lectin domain protein [Actinoplanes regularis]GIE85403.1 glucosylceramidase [Actinoplanes regularis]SNR72273.1 glucosylceramidase [Actinoplanes regularis]
MTRPRSAGLLVGLLATAGLFVPQAAQAAPAASVQAWFSSESRTAGYEPKNANWYTSPATGLAGTPYQLSRQADIATAAAGGTATISVDTDQKFQTVLGVGSSLEESTIFNLARMSAAGRTNALRALVDPNAGAGFNVARITFGTSDFTSHDFYTYDDGAADPSLSRFSIQRDLDYKIISTVREALAINPNLKIFASAWSAPPWMKSSNAIITGSLLDQYIPTLATYYRKAIQAYAAQGIPIYGLTLQNEPLFEPADYPGMKVTADQERRLAIALRAELTNNGLGATRIWAFDHNFSEGVSYAQGVLTNDARSSVDGIAFHDYAGDPSAMATVKAQFPDKDVLMTERSVWGTSGADRVVQYFRNQSTLYQGWVSMLDQNRSPERWSGSPDPTMLVQSTSNPDTFWKTPDYNMIAQFSKFVQPGAKRVATGYGSTGTVTDVAFVNPDNSLVTVVVNQTASNQTFTLRAGSRQFTSTLPAKTTGTYVWAGAGDAGTSPSRSGQITGYGGKCVDVPGASSANGTQVQLYTCNGTSAQTWTVGSDGTIRALGKCLDVNAASSANGTKVQIYDCNGTAAQQWTAGTDGTLRSLGKCLDATGPSSADGTKLQIWDCFAGDNQRWTLP